MIFNRIFINSQLRNCKRSVVNKELKPIKRHAVDSEQFKKGSTTLSLIITIRNTS